MATQQGSQMHALSHALSPLQYLSASPSQSARGQAYRASCILPRWASVRFHVPPRCRTSVFHRSPLRRRNKPSFGPASDAPLQTSFSKHEQAIAPPRLVLRTTNLPASPPMAFPCFPPRHVKMAFLIRFSAAPWASARRKRYGASAR